MHSNVWWIFENQGNVRMGYLTKAKSGAVVVVVVVVCMWFISRLYSIEWQDVWWMMNWKECERKWSLRYYTGICLEGLRKTRKTSARIVNVLAEIQTKYPLNKNLEDYCYTNHLNAVRKCAYISVHSLLSELSFTCTCTCICIPIIDLRINFELRFVQYYFFAFEYFVIVLFSVF
jgi:hypothetical protein